MIDRTALDFLRTDVRTRMGEKRYRHTLGVEEAAMRLGSYLLPERIPELRAAALLHDISKELPTEEHLRLLAENGYTLSDSDATMPALLHAYTAPIVVARDFAAFALPEILSAIACHTTGKADMTTFEKIIFIADYIEDGRTYPTCVCVRDRLYAELDRGSGERALNEAVLASCDATITSLVGRTSPISEQTVLTRNAMIAKLYRL